MVNLMGNMRNSFIKIIIRAILIYRKNTSARVMSLSRSCIFTPTCSKYMCISVRRFGLIKGVQLGLNRIYRCSYKRSDGGYDYVPKIKIY